MSRKSEDGRVRLAAACWLALSRLGWAPSKWLIEAAVGLYRAGSVQVAASCWEAILARGNNLTPEQLSDASVCFAASGRLAQAVNCSLLAVGRAPADPVTAANAASVLVRTGDYAAALRLYDTALASGGDDPATWNNIGIMLDGLGKGELALACYERALALAPRDRRILENLLSSLGGQERWVAALDILETRAGGGQLSQSAYWGYKAEILEGCGRTEEALDYYNRLLRLA